MTAAESQSEKTVQVSLAQTDALPGSNVKTDGTDGLSDGEAARRLQEIRSTSSRKAFLRRYPVLVAILRRIFSPLALILIIASVASLLMGERTDASIILVIVAVSTALDFAQTFHSQRAADRLRRQVAPTATVKRSGVWRELSPDEIMPGDRIRLHPGDLVPADAIVVETGGLFVQQSALTGEPLPVEKRAVVSSFPATNAPAAPDDPCRVFRGTSVTSGGGESVVTATGESTAFGQIAQRLAARPPETEFERGMRELSLMIARAVFLLVLFVFLTSTLLHRPALKSFLFAVALAVGLTPEFLPMITTVTLGRGAVRMAKRKVVVKHLQAIENLGGMDVLCSDKTGTLTGDSMRLASSVSALDSASSARVLALGRLNSRLGNEASPSVHGDALDTALAGASALPREPGSADAVLLRTLPFDFERRRASVAVSWQGQTLLITKGAPEAVIALCESVEQAGGDSVPLTETARDAASETYRRLSAEGFRVLAVAVRAMDTASAPKASAGDETGMTLAGFLAFENPPLPDVRDVLARLRDAGVTIKLLTGDNDLVTRHLCESAGLPAERIVTGDELDQMDDVSLGQVVEEVTVFARVSPAQKNRVLLALKRRGHVVGFMGDGINDAPSLHTADVGISVSGATDVARDAAEIILLEKSLDVLCDGILEGRRAYGNVLKYLLMNLSSNFGNMLSMAAAPLLLPFLPMLPAQILLNNFLYDLSQIAIPTDNVDPGIIRQPRRWDMHPIRIFMLFAGPISSLYDMLTFYVLRTVFHASEAFFHTGWFVESLITQALVIFVIRASSGSKVSSFPEANRPSMALIASIAAICLVAVLLPYSQFAHSLGFVPLPPFFFVFVAIVTGMYLALVGLAKKCVLNRFYEKSSPVPPVATRPVTETQVSHAA